MFVILLRDDTDAAAKEWFDTLAARGHEAIFLPVLTTTRSMSAVALGDLLCEETPPWAVALTSRHAAAALLEALVSDLRIASALIDTRIFCVGTRTALQFAGSSVADRVEVVDDTSGGGGGAAALATALLAAAAAMGEIKFLNVLFLCGDTRLDILPAALAGGPLRCRELTIYTSTPRSATEVAVAAAAGAHASVVIAFSPSGLSTAAAAGIFSGAVPRALVTLGATTAAAARTAGLLVAGVAVSPTPAAVADALDTLF